MSRYKPWTCIFYVDPLTPINHETLGWCLFSPHAVLRQSQPHYACGALLCNYGARALPSFPDSWVKGIGWVELFVKSLELWLGFVEVADFVLGGIFRAFVRRDVPESTGAGVRERIDSVVEAAEAFLAHFRCDEAKKAPLGGPAIWRRNRVRGTSAANRRHRHLRTV